MGIVRESFIVFKNWKEAIKELPDDLRLEVYDALMEYGLTGVIPQGLSQVAKALLISFSAGINTSIERYTASVENGKLGGAPVGNSNAKKQPRNNLEQPKPDLKQPRTTKNNHTDTVTDTDILNININAGAHDDYIYNYSDIIKAAEECCPILATRHKNNLNADYELQTICDEMISFKTPLSAIKRLFNKASKCYYVQPKFSKLDICWVLNNQAEVKVEDEMRIKSKSKGEVIDYDKDYNLLE